MPRKESTPKKKSPSLIVVITGSDAFLRRQALGETVRQYLGQADPALAYSEYDGQASGVSSAEVLDDVRTLPFLADARVVVVKDADSFITRSRSELEAYAESPSDTGVLILECKSLPSNTRLYKRVRQVGQVIKCDSPKARELPGWLASRAQQVHGKKLQPQAASLICELVGDDLGLLDGEVEKLSLYVGDRPSITRADVEQVVGHHREEKVWGILSGIAAGKVREALTIWEDVWQTDRAASARAIAGIAFTVRRLLNAKRAQEAGASMQELSRLLMAWNNPQRVRAELSAFTTAQVEDMLCRLLEADIAAKTGTASVRASIERFIIEASLARQQKATA